MFSMEMMKKMAKHYAVPEFKENPLQMFAEAVSGKKIVYLYRIASKAATNNGVALAFTTENERTKSKDADSTETKDGPIRTPGASETEITATSILAKEDELVDDLEEAMDNDELIEIWRLEAITSSKECTSRDILQRLADPLLRKILLRSA